MLEASLGQVVYCLQLNVLVARAGQGFLCESMLSSSVHVWATAFRVYGSGLQGVLQDYGDHICIMHGLGMGCD